MKFTEFLTTIFAISLIAALMSGYVHWVGYGQEENESL